MKFTRLIFLLLTLSVIGSVAFAGLRPSSLSVATPAAQPPNIGVNGYFSMDKAQRGRTIQAALLLDIPGGYHVNSNKPIGKYQIPTSVKIEVGDGVKASAVSYPRAIVKSFSFSDEKLAVFEGRAYLRFNLTIPAAFPHSKMLVKARVKYQSCSDSECYAPATREKDMWIEIAGENETVKPANGQVFGGKRK
jgi:DsbC/DsbD-like thiol-disulfide interchange protein